MKSLSKTLCPSVTPSGKSGCGSMPSQVRPAAVQSLGMSQPSVKHGSGKHVPHALVTPSSTIASQSSSIPLQVSIGSASPQTPHELTSPSSSRPSQSVSTPSQLSVPSQ